MLKAIKIKEDVIEVNRITKIIIDDGIVSIEYDDKKSYLLKKDIKMVARFQDVEFISGE